jgi:hypothetical protein
MHGKPASVAYLRDLEKGTGRMSGVMQRSLRNGCGPLKIRYGLRHSREQYRGPETSPLPDSCVEASHLQIPKTFGLRDYSNWKVWYGWP